MRDSRRVELLGKPIPLRRHRTAKGRAYNPQAALMQSERWKLRAKVGPFTPLECPVAVRCKFIFEIPKSWPKAKRESAHWHDIRPDLDNLEKWILDVATGVLWLDDKVVCCKQSNKCYGPTACTILEWNAL